MVHQLCLVSTIPYNKYVQTVSTLQAFTGLISPQDISTYTMLCKPINVFKPKFEPGKVNQIESYYMKLITTWDEPDIDINQVISETAFTQKLFSGESGTANNVDKTWTLQISDIPIAGKNQVCSAQTIYELTLVHNHVLMDRIKNDDGAIDDTKDSFLYFLNDLGYEVINQYWIKGIRFFHGDIIIEITKIFIRNDTYSGEEQPTKIPLKLLDESNGFQVKAFINVPKVTDLDLINQGLKDLMKLQEFLKNLVKFEIPDRIYMDSRVAK